MSENPSIILLDEPATGTRQPEHCVSIVGFELYVFGESELFHIGLRDIPARLADLVPMARSLCTAIVQIVCERIAGRGVAVPCRKGCTSCCNHLICLSVPEAFRLMEEMNKMPSRQRKRIEQSCRTIVRKVEKRLPKTDYLSELTLAELSDYYLQLRELLGWYFKERIPCPLLCDSLCTIYEQRPVVCREHMVIGSDSPCQVGCAGQKDKIESPISIPTVLTELSSELECMNPEFVMLPYIFDWHERNAARRTQTWPAPFIVERFVNIAFQSQKWILPGKVGNLKVSGMGN